MNISFLISKQLDRFESIFHPHSLDLFEIVVERFFPSYTSGKVSLIDRKVEQIQNGSKGHPKRLLLLQAAYDPDKAFPMRSHVATLHKLSKTHEIHLVTIGTENDLLTRLPPGQFDTIWIRAHGTPTTIYLGSHDDALTFKTHPRVFVSLANKIKKGGKVILESCNTGRHTHAIAKRIASFCLDATVYAPMTSPYSICGLQFDERGFPEFYDGLLGKKGKVTRRIDGPESKEQISKLKRAWNWSYRIFSYVTRRHQVSSCL